MSALVERVARALWLDEYPELPWEGSGRNERIKEDYRGHARAAIAAMREPTEGMIVAGGDIPEADPCEGDIWRAMIDAALK